MQSVHCKCLLIKNGLYQVGILLQENNTAGRNCETLNTTNAASSSLAAENIFTSITRMHNSSAAKSTWNLRATLQLLLSYSLLSYPSAHTNTHTLASQVVVSLSSHNEPACVRMSGKWWGLSAGEGRGAIAERGEMKHNFWPFLTLLELRAFRLPPSSAF